MVLASEPSVHCRSTTASPPSGRDTAPLKASRLTNTDWPLGLDGDIPAACGQFRAPKPLLGPRHTRLDPMYGELGNKLVQHAKRMQSLSHLPPYQTEMVRSVAREVRELDKDVARILEPFEGTFNPSENHATACALLVDHLSMRRNKRCLLAYHRARAEKLEEFCWQGRDVLDEQMQQGGGGAQSGGSQANSLSPEEMEYFRQYSDMLAAYKGQWIDIDLTGSLEPPKDLFIDVRVLKDAGEIQTEYGAITLTKNSQFYVRLGDVERLIAQGYLQRLS
ncbi:PSF1 domain-containing protein [Histoplasma capsulatum var. duboisii H88]|nr:PSF1 domain-containing protein [Histoplasma capsulatum H143]EGC43264.1 PSF1 domain-containing protein [Histoplasma capsulatum var. duboisii H88]